MTVSIPAMPVRAALGMLYKQGDSESPWEFKGGLDTARMPGAKFYRFPRDEAAKVLLVAAGLAPPASGKVVASKGSVRLSDIIQYTPVRSDEQTGYGGGYGGYGGHAGYPARPYGAEFFPAVAIAAYKSEKLGGKRLFTVLSAKEYDSFVIEKLLVVNGGSHVMANLDVRSGPTGGPFYGSMQVSVAIYDVTLDQALDSILPGVLLKYRKQGPPDNPIYVIYPSEPIVIWRADEATTAPGKPQPPKK